MFGLFELFEQFYLPTRRVCASIRYVGLVEARRGRGEEQHY